MIKELDSIMDRVHSLIKAADMQKNHTVEGHLRRAVEYLLAAKLNSKPAEPPKPKLMRRLL